VGKGPRRNWISSASQSETGLDKAQDQPGRSTTDHRGNKETLAVAEGGSSEIGGEVYRSGTEKLSGDG